MDYLVLVAPFLIILTFFVGLICFLLRRKWVGLTLISAAFVWNFFIEAVPLNLFCSQRRAHLRILTFNIYSSSDYFRSVKENPRDVCAMLLSADADVIVLEEYYPDLCSALRDSLLRHYPYFEFQQDWTYCSNAVFSRFPLSGWSELKIVAGADAADDADMQRARQLDGLRNTSPNRSVSSLWVKFPAGSLRPEQPADSLRLIACHLSSNHFDQAREAFAANTSLRHKIKTIAACFEAGHIERGVEVRHIMNDVQEMCGQGKKVIVLGDMNDVAGSSTLSSLKSGGLLLDAWWERGCGPGLTFHSHRLMHFRLDHILHSPGLRLTGIGVRSERFSDHRPLVADFEF